MCILPATFLLFFLQIVYAIRGCSISRCSGDDIPVRFPFYLEGQQLQDCGFPGFNLKCDNQSNTVLKLPYSGEFLVRGINYLTQEIQLYDSDDCLAKRLLNFNLSGSPFVAATFQNYTFLSCPTQLVRSHFTTIHCLSNSTISVLATSSISLVNVMPDSCQTIVTLSIPVSSPAEYSEEFSSQLNNDLHLLWYEPDCAQCEGQGGMCGFQRNTTETVGCSFSSKTGLILSFCMTIQCIYYLVFRRNYSETGGKVPEIFGLAILRQVSNGQVTRRKVNIRIRKNDIFPVSGGSNKSLRIFKIICMSIAVPSVVFAAAISLFFFATDRRPRINAARWNQTTSSVSPQPTNMVTGLDESTIQSYQELVLGESKRVPGPNDNKCAICLSEYQSKETIRCIPECNHCFHTACIDEWLRRNNTCPVCRNSPSPARDSSVQDASETV